ncbi:Hydroxysteroid dehydrogenase-like protein 2 [Dissostichus eleginoides]|uniref:Hydroxysteroid dehydrogenase-like protein 2 n=1 Tax=Dissostichus eleginoides TaxID=100907 RepID=A0AAD9EWH8_DISEL|nr:Hydroxysteroid dehydrogenase-like protein 2 [Dissostichus eleginoides]
MLQNTGKLRGCTLFITGASRGIGKAIALKAARDGANIVIAAKTAEPHPKLPGTIYSAAKEAIKRFGGIDILVNNASAISLTGTLETPLKRSRSPHILNLSPPLNLNPIWFKNHTAYTMAKYGMSMCVLGMAEEFRGQVAVNALWPKTGNITIFILLGLRSETRALCHS